MKILHIFDSLKFVRAMFVAVATFAFAFAPAHAATLPAGYTELEYLQTAGNSHIDTGILLSNTDRFRITFQNIASGAVSTSIMGAISGGTTYTSNGNLSVTYVDGAYAIYSNGGVGSANLAWRGGNYADKIKHTIIYNGLNVAPTIDGVAMTRPSQQSLTENDPTVTTWLFGRNNTGNGNNTQVGIRIYEFSVSGKAHFIPARRDSDGVLGMYDLMDSNPETAFHTNEGTGNFIAGPAVPIKIATTKYNEQQFAPVETDLDAAVAAVNRVVTDTMTQAQAIDTIATSKQTRPDEGCTAKYCLLVEDENGTPHWYPIAGANGVEYVLPSGYTELQYIRLANGAFIITDIYPNQDTEFIVDFQLERDAIKWLFGTRGYPADASNDQNPINKFALQVFSTSNGSVWMQFDNTTKLEYGTNTVASDDTSRLARHQCGIKNQRVWCDGNFISWNSSNGPTNISNFTATNPLVIGAVQTSTGYSSATFIGKIYSATDLVPCRRDSDSAVGLCRTSTGGFFGNSADVGTITAGPDA